MTPDGRPWIEAGDPTLLGWLTSLGYLLAALMALRAWHNSRFYARMWRTRDAQVADRQDRLTSWWLGVAVLMILLGLNKELDLQRLVTVWGKAAAISEGWYGDRGAVQRLFIGFLMLLCIGACAATLYYVRNVRVHIVRSLLGMVLVLAYALLRAMVFNLADTRVAQVAGFMWVLETIGIVLVVWCAARGAGPGMRRP